MPESKIFWTTTCLKQKHGQRGYKSESSHWIVKAPQPKGDPRKAGVAPHAKRRIVIAKKHYPQTCYEISCQSPEHNRPEYSLYLKRVNVRKT